MAWCSVKKTSATFPVLVSVDQYVSNLDEGFRSGIMNAEEAVRDTHLYGSIDHLSSGRVSASREGARHMVSEGLRNPVMRESDSVWVATLVRGWTK
jgi:hypothetical protein